MLVQRTELVQRDLDAKPGSTTFPGALEASVFSSVQQNGLSHFGLVFQHPLVTSCVPDLLLLLSRGRYRPKPFRVIGCPRGVLWGCGSAVYVGKLLGGGAICMDPGRMRLSSACLLPKA
jgi:hypothetical protein